MARGARRGSGQGRGRRASTDAALALTLTAGLIGGCGSSTVELVAIRGCGLDQAFSGLRVRVLGDLPVGAGTQLLLGPGEVGELDGLPDAATGVAAEGLFGTTVTAVGRSWGADPDLFGQRLERRGGALPVWFAAPDSLCAVSPDTELRGHVDAGVAGGPAADLLVVGGRDGGGELGDAIVHVDLLSGEAQTLAGSLASPVRGPIVVAGPERRFSVVAGVGAAGPVGRWAMVDVEAGTVDDRGALSLAGETWAVAEFAVARRAGLAGLAGLAMDGSLLVAGGCTQTSEAGACESGSAVALAGTLEWASGVVEPLPPLAVPRHGASAAWSSDGLAWVAGGWGVDGGGLASLERLRPGGAWTVVHDVAEVTVVGLALVDGGLALLADDAGAIHWWSEAGSGTLDPTSRAPALGPTMQGQRRPMLVLPGERVLIGGWLFSPGSVALDPALERVRFGAGERANTALELLADGSIVLARAEGDALAVERLRPRLDGPDEWIPDLTGPDIDAFVTTAPGSSLVGVAGLRVTGTGTGEAGIAAARAHVRGFRSASARLEFEFESEPGAVAQLVIGQGSETLVAIDLDGPEAGTARRRSPDAGVELLACELGPGALAGPLVVELASLGSRLTLSAAEGQVLACELDWPGAAAPSLGFGVRGTASARFFGLRLARI